MYYVGPHVGHVLNHAWIIGCRFHEGQGEPNTSELPAKRSDTVYEDYIKLKTDSVYFTARGVVIHQGGGAVGGDTGRRAALRATSCFETFWPSGSAGVK